MYILYSPPGDPMLLDCLEGMATTHQRLLDFLSSSKSEIVLTAETAGSLAPHETFLSGLRIRKTDGPINLEMSSDSYLSLSGSPQNLSLYVAYFKFEGTEDGNHHHPEYVLENGEPRRGYLTPSSLSLIIEVNSDLMESIHA
jgi:hypothetical protein